jgi:two-component system response regulator QseB
MRLLVIDSNAKARRAVCRAVVDLGHIVEDAATGLAAAARIGGGGFDAIVLDTDLSDGDGVELVARMRRAGDATPVLLMRQAASSWERADGLNAGADDYIEKSILLDELLARVNALLRRPRDLVGPRVVLGSLVLNSVERQAYADGSRIRLTRLQYRLLEALLRRYPSVVPIEALKRDMYGRSEIRSNTVDKHLAALRKQLSQCRCGVRISSVTGQPRGLLIEPEQLGR